MAGSRCHANIRRSKSPALARPFAKAGQCHAGPRSAGSASHSSSRSGSSSNFGAFSSFPSSLGNEEKEKNGFCINARTDPYSHGLSPQSMLAGTLDFRRMHRGCRRCAAVLMHGGVARPTKSNFCVSNARRAGRASPLPGAFVWEEASAEEGALDTENGECQILPTAGRVAMLPGAFVWRGHLRKDD